MKNLLRSLLAPLLLGSSLLAGPQAAQTPAPPAPAEPEPLWSSSLDEAIGRAREIPDGRILVELRTATCPECKRMADLVYPSASFRAFVKDKVPVTLDREGADGQKLAQRFGVRVSPAWLVLTPDLLLCGRQEGESNQSTWIDRFIESEKGWAAFRRRIDEEKASPSDTALVFAVAEEAYRRYGNDMAEGRFRRLAADPKTAPEIRERSLAYLASIALDARRLDDAEKALTELLAVAKDPVLRERAELRLADVEVGRGNRARAAERLEAFLKAHPESPARPQVESLLQALGATGK